jgi:hypothetical protein
MMNEYVVYVETANMFAKILNMQLQKANERVGHPAGVEAVNL